MGCSSSETGCSSGVPFHGVLNPASKPASAEAPLSTVPQVLPGACSSMVFPEAQYRSGHIHLLMCGAFHGLQMDIQCGPLWAAGEQPAALCYGIWSTSTSSSVFTDLGVCMVASLPPSRFSLQLLLSIRFFPILKYVSSYSVLDPAGIGSIGQRGSFWCLFIEANPVVSAATEMLPCKPKMVAYYMKDTAQRRN
ncbi:hypothetical protein BTVI_104065 [Pitangus sulphuratus]|nr:hypothetical protein BTVI_104065 [Pitangus sulphuratus]